MVLLEADPFLTELMAMYKGNRVRGSVVVTMKRSSCRVGGGMRAAQRGVPFRLPPCGPSRLARGPASAQTPKKQLDAKEEDYVCLVRATDGKRKISTMVPASKQVGSQSPLPPRASPPGLGMYLTYFLHPRQARFQDAYVTILKASTDKLKRPAESVKKPQGGAAKSKGASHGDASKG